MIIDVSGNRVTVKETLEECKQRYLELIQEAQLLGETEEVTKLQSEWKQKKSEFVTQ